MGVIELKWQCEKCEDIIVSHSNKRHQMDYCKCGKSYVDLEKHYERGSGYVKEISRKEI
jgi:hypothetical protein